MPGPVFLCGEAVDLHTVEADDVPFLGRLVNDPDVRETLGSVLPYNERQRTEWFEALDPDDLAFLVRADDDPVGYAELVDHFLAWGWRRRGDTSTPNTGDRGTPRRRSRCSVPTRSRRSDSTASVGRPSRRTAGPVACSNGTGSSRRDGCGSTPSTAASASTS